MRQLVVASGNRGKLEEIAQILGGSALSLVSQGELGIADVDETGITFVENALLKARNAARHCGLAALGDDSGLCVDALDGAPGLRSARYAGAHGDAQRNIAKLLHALRDVPAAQRGARFHCTIVLLRHAEDPAPLIAEGSWRGFIADAPHGDRGFGYDPVFFVPEHACTAAELEPEVKNRISHRGIALAALRAQLEGMA